MTQIFSWESHHKFPRMPGHLQRDIGLLSVLETKISGTGHLPINPVENGIKQRRKSCWTSRRVRFLYFLQPVLCPECHWRVSIHFNTEPQTAELCFVQCLQPISSVSTKQWRIGVTTSLVKQQIFLLKDNLKKFLLILYDLTKHRNWNQSAQEDLERKQDEEVSNLSETSKFDAACEDAGFVKTVCVGQFFMTRSEVQLSMFGNTSACREYTLPRDHLDSYPKGVIGINAKIGPALGVVVTKRYELYGIEVKIDSLKKDGTKSWVVISRSIVRYVTELALDHNEPMRLDEHCSHGETRSVDDAVNRVDFILFHMSRNHSDETKKMGTYTRGS